MLLEGVRSLGGGVFAVFKAVYDMIYFFVQQSFVKRKVMPFLSFITKLDVWSTLAWVRSRGHRLREHRVCEGVVVGWRVYDV